MRSPRAVARVLVVALIAMAALLVLAAVAGAQEPSDIGPLPGQEIEPPPTPLWLTLIAWAVALGALGVVVLLAGSYLFLSRRFFAREEPPPPPRRPAVRVSPGMGVPPPGRAVGHPVSETTPQGAGATTAAAAAPGGTATATAERPKEEAPAEAPAEEAPKAEAAPAPAKHSGPAELDQETFDRVRKEQLDAGASPKVAEGRAKAAAVKAAREKKGAG